MKSKLHQPTLAAFAVTLAFLSATSPAFAQRNWIGPNPDDNWFTSTNWSPAGAPTLTDDTNIDNGTAATVAAAGATTQALFLGNGGTGTLNISGTGELTAAGLVHVGFGNTGTLNITGGGTLRHPTFDAHIGDSAGVDGFATVTGAGSNWLLQNLVIGYFGHGTLNILNGGLVTGFDAFIAQKDNSTGLVVVDGTGGASTLQLGLGNFFVGGDATGAHGTGVLRVFNGGIVNSNRLVVLPTGTLEIGATPMITVVNPAGIEYDGGTLKTIANTTFSNKGSIQAGGIILDSNGFTSTLSGIYSGSGGLTKIGAGSITLTNDNTYTGGTTLENGVLAVGSLNALGTNSVVVNGGTLQTFNGPRAIDVQANYTQNGGGTLRLQIGGIDSGSDSDFLIVSGNAALNGTLSLVRINNYNPAAGDRVDIIGGGTHTGAFSTVTSTFLGVLQPIVHYDEANDVYLLFQLNSFNIGGLTPNQKSVARNLDVAANDPAAAPLINFLELEALGNLPHDYDLIAPEELAAIYEISISSSMIQNNNLQRRMDDIRAGSNGFCANGFTPQVSGKDVSKDSSGKVVLDQKQGPDVYVPTANNRWGVFINGTGDFVNVGDADSNAPGYDITTGDFTLGVDYRVCDNFAIGIDGGYSGSRADLVDDGRIETNGGKIGAYATWFGKGFFGSKFYVDGTVGGGLNNYDTRRTGLQNELVRGDTDGTEFNAMISYGSDWTFGCFNIGTWSSVQFTNVNIDEFTETGSLAPLIIEDQDENSFRATTGVHASYDIKAGHVLIRPEVRAAYQHEYCDSAYQIDSQLASGAGGIFRVRGPRIGRDAALVDAGVNVQWSNRFSTYVYYDGVLGRNNYDNNAVSGGLRFGF